LNISITPADNNITISNVNSSTGEFTVTANNASSTPTAVYVSINGSNINTWSNTCYIAVGGLVPVSGPTNYDTEASNIYHLPSYAKLNTISCDLYTFSWTGDYTAP